MKISQTNINNTGNIDFEAGKVVISFSKPEGVELFKNLYNAKVTKQVDNFYEFAIDLSKSPIGNIEEILKKYSKGLPINISSIEFSSLESIQTFTAVIDFLTSHYDVISSIELNQIGKPKAPVKYPISKNYDGDNYVFNKNQFNFGPPSTQGLQIYKSSAPVRSFPDNPPGDVLNSWWLATPHVETAHKLSIGNNVTASIIDIGQFVLSHPDMKELNSSGSRFLSQSSATPTQLLEADFKGISDIFQQDNFHSMSCAFVGFGRISSRDVRYNTMGIAPGTKVIPYRSFTPINWASDINDSLNKGAQVISMSIGVLPAASIAIDLSLWVPPIIPGIPPNGVPTGPIANIILNSILKPSPYFSQNKFLKFKTYFW